MGFVLLRPYSSVPQTSTTQTLMAGTAEADMNQPVTETCRNSLNKKWPKGRPITKTRRINVNKKRPMDARALLTNRGSKGQPVTETRRNSLNRKWPRAGPLLKPAESMSTKSGPWGG